MSFQDLEAGRPLRSQRKLINGNKEGGTQAVASGIFEINTAVSTFQRLVNTLGTPKDTPDLRDKLHKTRLHIGQLVKDTSAKLKEASETDHHRDVSQSKKIADAKLAKDFEAVLKDFQKAQRVAAERETSYTPFDPKSDLSSSDRFGRHGAWRGGAIASSPQYPMARRHTHGGRYSPLSCFLEGAPSHDMLILDKLVCEVDIGHDRSQEQRVLMESRRQEVVLLENEISFNEAVIEEREQGIQEVQQQIGEVNEIFKDLAVLVHDQGAMIDDIGSHVENAHSATAQGRSHLVKASRTQRSNSSLMCLLMVIFGIVLLIVVIVLAA
ncbi:hypothetical protein F2Q70_00020981 [Brassica cretica]|uniref:t-SNARE coiled-coil homology domain-containing protein n=2 Tax=Brassica cretica TaxID=69181 RepID=A0A8S9GML5_BRACR|nr:hypothetical protein F2Q70_00020981 [Brassica cretica]KAF2557851.1 hypothetical protein F2Q68_00014455 [Brassica cretica]KAF3605861.1 hypothetical protein DY000_02046950 [Brassica cretica]